MRFFKKKIKRSFWAIYIYDLWLSWRCRNVSAYLFVASTGRSGTDSLSKILESLKDSVTTHEPYPEMINHYRETGEEKSLYFLKAFRELKRIYIKRAAAGHRVYVETNHNFIKNFCFSAAGFFGEKLRIAHVYRDPVSVAASFLKLNSIPGETRSGKYYMCCPNDKDNALQMTDFIGQYQGFDSNALKCLWYFYEIEARVFRFISVYPGIKISHIPTVEISNKARMTSMFDELDLPFDAAVLDRVINTRKNQKAERKAEQAQEIDMSRIGKLNEELFLEIQKRYPSIPFFEY